MELEESESAQKYGQGDFVLPVNAMNEMMKIYLPDGADLSDIRIAPGRATDLSGFRKSMNPIYADGTACFASTTAISAALDAPDLDGSSSTPAGTAAGRPSGGHAETEAEGDEAAAAARRSGLYSRVARG